MEKPSAKQKLFNLLQEHFSGATASRVATGIENLVLEIMNRAATSLAEVQEINRDKYFHQIYDALTGTVPEIASAQRKILASAIAYPSVMQVKADPVPTFPAKYGDQVWVKATVVAHVEDYQDHYRVNIMGGDGNILTIYVDESEIKK